MPKLLRILLLVLFFVQPSFSQDVKFGKVSKEALQERFYAKDSTADASVLYRNVSVSFQYVVREGFVVKKRVHERIKIYNKGGFGYGTITESLYKGSNNLKETISKLKACTYNLNGNEIQKTKLKGSEIFKEEASKYYYKKKFTMPNLKEGSVIEYEYVISSPYYSSFDEVILQYDIPIKQQEIKVAIPEYFTFKNTSKGYISYDLQKSYKSGNITLNNATRTSNPGFTGVNKTSYSSSKIDFQVEVSSVQMQDVPALKEEDYVNSMENYRSAITYELQYTKFPNSMLENYAGSWASVVKKIYENQEFGSQIDYRKYYKADLAQVISDKVTEEAKLNAIYAYVQTRMNWNGIYGYYTDEGVKKAYNLRTGNVADINLMLVSMLRSAGLKANPVLVSTRSNGVPLFPTRYGFNYVIASVNVQGAEVFLDATSTYAKPNMLPVRTLNWAGRIVKEGGSSTSVSLFPKYTSLESVTMVASIDSKGNAKGKIRRGCKDYIAYKFRTQNSDLDQEAYLEKLEANYNGLEISDYTIKNKNTIGKQLTESLGFNRENSAEIIGDKMYISPLLWFSQTENPFKSEERKYPVDYAYPWQDKYAFTINIPEGYEVESIPASINVSFGEKMGQFIFHTSKTPLGIQVKVELTMNTPIIPPQNYQGLKDFYKAIVEKQTEKVVLSKI